MVHPAAFTGRCECGVEIKEYINLAMRSHTTTMKPHFEEAFRVEKIDENTWRGAHPLRLPIPGARGVYGGHTCAQTLLVAIELAPDFVPHSFHSHFIRAGKNTSPYTYKVHRLNDGRNFCMREIEVVQDDRRIYVALCLLVRKGTKITLGDLDIQQPPPPLHHKYRDPEQLHVIRHTDYVRNAYSDEFVDYKLCPEEDNLRPLERWVTVWSGVDETLLFKDKKFNYVGLADVSDSALLTTLARVMHLHWNPTVDNPMELYDEDRDARNIMKMTLNALHIFHYDAMLLDHHLYFHCDSFDAFDPVRDWLTFTYQFKIVKNNRSLVRGFFYNNAGQCVCTVLQEGLTHMRPGVPNQPHM